MTAPPKVAQVIPLMVSQGLLQYSRDQWDHCGHPVIARNSRASTTLFDNDPRSAAWLLEHFTRGVSVEANTDSFEFIQPQRWSVRVSACVDFYGTGIGRTFAEAVFRAFWHMFAVEKPTPAWLSETRQRACEGTVEI